jgi:hypothetical protein
MHADLKLFRNENCARTMPKIQMVRRTKVLDLISKPIRIGFVALHNALFSLSVTGSTVQATFTNT